MYHRRSQSGMSLVELLMALAIGGFVVVAVGAFFVMSKDVMNTVSAATEQNNLVSILDLSIRSDISKSETISADGTTLSLVLNDGTPVVYRTVCLPRTAAHALAGTDIGDIIIKMNTDILADADPMTTDLACSPTEYPTVERQYSSATPKQFFTIKTNSSRNILGAAMFTTPYSGGVSVVISWFGTPKKGVPTTLDFFRAHYMAITNFVEGSIIF